MKIRLILSALTLLLNAFAQATFKFFYSPIAGVATAQSVNEDIASYGMAKFVRDGGVEQLLVAITLFALFCIWVNPVCRVFKSYKTN